MVLAESARQVAARRPKAQHRRPGQEMVERLLFDRVDAKAAGSAVGRQHDLITLPPPHKNTAPAARLATYRTAGRRRTEYRPSSTACQYRPGNRVRKRLVNVIGASVGHLLLYAGPSSY